MPRAEASSSESENDDPPESISLSRSKKDTQRLEAERRNAEVIQRRAKRDKNRDLDRKLKERAVINQRGKISVDKTQGGKSVVEKRKRRRKVNEEKDKSREPDELESRMRRAMKEAELESNEEDFMDIIKDGGAAEENDDDDNDGPDVETTVRNPNHLPDELFAAAFSSSSKRTTLQDDATLIPPAKKRKSSSLSKEDIVVGSRAIRILPDSSAPPVPSTIPSKKINKFLNRTLALKNGKQNLRTKGWERRPVNIGILKRDGPPVSFVRNK